MNTYSWAMKDNQDDAHGKSRHPSGVAVIIPCYNQAHFLGDALRSVTNQVPRPSEIIVIDDGSPDTVADAVHPFAGVRLVRTANRGLSAARNEGLRLTQSPYLVFLDADDTLLPGALNSGLAALGQDESAAFTWGGYINMDVDGNRFGPSNTPGTMTDPLTALLSGNVIGMHAAVMYRRDPLVASGAFDETLRACEDYDLYLRLARDHPITPHATPVAAYRRHAEGMSRDYGRLIEAGLTVLRRHRPRPGDPPHRRRAYRAGAWTLVALNLKRALIQGMQHLARGDAAAMVSALKITWRYAPGLFAHPNISSWRLRQ